MEGAALVRSHPVRREQIRIYDVVMLAMIALAFLAFVLACLSPWIGAAWAAL
jgi:hypothetical protein